MRFAPIANLSDESYPRHALHREGCVWVEKNCYVDIWIEGLHALGLQPEAMLPFTAAIDFEGDQWTFFKPSHDELRNLYGIDVQEMNVWRPLLEHAVEHLSAGKLLCVESDAFWLPDTAGTDYRHQHTKTTILMADLDIDQQRLGYFHNAGYFTLSGEDFARTFRLGVPHDPEHMPLFAELVRLDRLVRRPTQELVRMSCELWRHHLQRIPTDNPMRRFRQRFEQDLPGMQEAGLARYHAWAFSTTRQLGAAFELAAASLRWLGHNGTAGVDPGIASFDEISVTCKTLILKGARAVNSRRLLDATDLFEKLSSAWERGVGSVSSALARD
jgi:hypothetical protein